MFNTSNSNPGISLEGLEKGRYKQKKTIYFFHWNVILKILIKYVK